MNATIVRANYNLWITMDVSFKCEEDNCIYGVLGMCIHGKLLNIDDTAKIFFFPAAWRELGLNRCPK